MIIKTIQILVKRITLESILFNIWRIQKNFTIKKARHPVGLFRIRTRGITPVVPSLHCYILLFLSGTSCSLCFYHRKIGESVPAVKDLN